MSGKTIRLQDVRSALMLAITKAATDESRRAAGDKTLARWAAYTCHVNSFGGHICATDPLGSRLDTLHRGGLPKLVETVHLHHGPAEVRRTWGAGVRALREEIKQGALR